MSSVSVDVIPTSSTSGRGAESVQSPTSVGSSTASVIQKDQQRPVTSYSHFKRLQPTVVLRHWNGVSNAKSPAKVKAARNGESSAQNKLEDVAVRADVCS